MRLATLAALAVLLAACDSTGPDVPGGQDPPGDAPSDEGLPIESGVFFPDGRGAAFGVNLYQVYGDQGTFGDGPKYESATEFSLYNTSLWLAGRQDGEARFSGSSNAFTPGYTVCPPDTAFRRYHLASGVDYALGEWPVDRGAPLAADGEPLVYGDLMTWSSYCTGVHRPDLPHHAPPTFEALRVNHAIFQHERSDLAGVRFFRYEVTNLGSTPVTDLRAGFYSDPDVNGGRYSGNLLGGTDRYATVYVSPNARATTAYGAVAAYGLLEAPRDATLAARRVEYRDAGPRPDLDSPPVPYTEWGLSLPQAPFFAMRGLDDTGAPIIDPTTGAASPFMYPGDPVAGTGWLDGTLPGGEAGWDIRVLQSTDPVTLGVGETVVLTAVVISTVQADLTAGLESVDARFTDIVADPSLWRFPVAGQ